MQKYRHAQNIQYLFLFHCNNGGMNMPQCYVIRTTLVSLNSVHFETGVSVHNAFSQKGYEMK